MLRLTSLSLSLPLSLSTLVLTGCASAVISGPEAADIAVVDQGQPLPAATEHAQGLARVGFERARQGRVEWLGRDRESTTGSAGDAGAASDAGARNNADAAPPARNDADAEGTPPNAPAQGGLDAGALDAATAPQPASATACPCACAAPAPTNAPAPTTAIPSSLHYPLNRPTLDDASGHNHPARATNGMRFVTDPLDGRLAWRSPGPSGSAVRVTLPGWGVAPKANDFSVSVWARSEDFIGPSANVGVIAAGLNVSLAPSWYASVPFVQASGSWYPFGGGTEESRLGPSGTAEHANDWWNVRYHLITVVWHRTSPTHGLVRTFRDATHISYAGEPYASNDGDQPFGTDVGHLPSDDFWNGTINTLDFGGGGAANAVFVRDVRFFDRALSDTEVANLFGAGTTL